MSCNGKRTSVIQLSLHRDERKQREHPAAERFVYWFTSSCSACESTINREGNVNARRRGRRRVETRREEEGDDEECTQKRLRIVRSRVSGQESGTWLAQCVSEAGRRSRRVDGKMKQELRREEAEEDGKETRRRRRRDAARRERGDEEGVHAFCRTKGHLAGCYITFAHSRIVRFESRRSQLLLWNRASC